MSRRVQWLVMLVLAAGALVVAASGDGGPATPAERAERIAAEVRCPTCENLSVAESEASASRAVRDEIRRRVDAGESDAEVRAYLVSRYGRDILLKPAASGVSALVWALPVAGGVLAVAGLVLAFRRWRRPLAAPSEEDRLLVAQARGER